MTRRADAFQTIHSEGGLLPPDLLRRLLEPKEKLPGTQPADYGLAPGERLNEVLTQSWNRLRRHWLAFREAAKYLAAGQPGEKLTNELWNLPLLRELGFGVLPFHPGPEINGRLYPIHYQSGPTPIHLIGCGRSLDRRVSGVQGNPHGLVQELLNRSPDHLWAIVANGLRLRVLRDSQALSRQSYLEFDLEALFDGEVYADFVLLWLVAHATRFAPQDAGKPDSCWLEQWTKLANEQGARALGDLRQGVERALQTLGQGLVGHPRNTALREALRDGTLTLNDLHGQLLRVVYRLIFLFVAEDRTLDGVAVLHPLDLPSPPVGEGSGVRGTARARYTAHYSTARLRQLAGTIKGSRHGDLWQQFNLLVGVLSGEERFAAAREALALPALGSWLWNPASTADLNAASLTGATGVELSNADFLEALRQLAFTRQGNVLRPVDYKNLGAEELGGVYESLLALTPRIEGGGSRFTFAEFAGNERKTSGSYYTPDSLVQCLLDSALDPVVEAAIAGKTGIEAEQALLALKVCDPAVGSGHFLVGAAHRLARHLARVRAQAEGDGEASPLLYQTALREVIGRCLYGVDVNPMSAELCRVNLWLEALEPGKPLSFLDHHIRVGNSLLGATPELIAAGIPDEAFKPITGDDPVFCREYKKQNQKERKSRSSDMFGHEPAPWERMGNLATAMAELEALDDDTVAGIQAKQARYEELVRDSGYLHGQLLADAWCAAFVWKKCKEPNRPYPILDDLLRKIEQNPFQCPPWMREEIGRLATQYQFFHWHLAFPEVFANGGFDVVLGNPPWDKIQPEEEKFFSPFRPDIADAPSAKVRKALIETLPNDDPEIHQVWEAYKRQIDGICQFLRSSGKLRFTGEGNLNSYRIFTELSAMLVAPNGRVGLVTQTGLATDESGKELFDFLLNSGRLYRFLDFENRGTFFPEVHQQFRFCLITIQGSKAASISNSAEFGWLLHSLDELNMPNRLVQFTANDLLLFNPSSKTCPVFTSRRDVEVSRCIYQHGEHIMLNENQRFASIDFLGELFNMTRDSALFLKEPPKNSLSLYEAKFLHQFDHRFATTSGSNVIELTEQLKQDSYYFISTKNFVEVEIVRKRTTKRGINTNWLFGFRSIASPTNERTAIAAVFPFSAVGNSINLILNLNAEQTIFLMVNANSFVFDFCARQKISGSNVNIWIFKQLPVIPLRAYTQPCPWSGNGETLRDWLLPRVLELTYTAWDLEPFAQDCGFKGPPFRWDEARRFLLRCELDAAFFHLYGIDRDDVAYIMDTFPIVKRKDEAAHGCYRTKDTILDMYDAMQQAMTTGQPYQTRLEPLPADVRCCHPARG